LSERLGIRKSSVTSIVADLLGRGVLREEVPGALRSPVAIEGGRFWALGAVLEAGRLHLARVGFDGEIGRRETVELAVGGRPEVLLDEVGRRLRGWAGSDGDGLSGVGVAVPGLVDDATGTGVFAVNLAGWRNVPVRAFLEERVGVRVLVGHDGRTQLLGNTWFATPQEAHRNVIHLCLKEGLSCGVMVDERVLAGNHFASGEIGCLPAGKEGRPCACGKRDCLQTYVSVPALAKAIRVAPRAGCDEATPAEAIAAAAEASPKAMAALDRAIAPLAEKLSTVMALIDPEVLLVGTESARLSAVLVPLLQGRLDTDLRGLYARPADVRPALPVTDAALRGLAAMVMAECFARGEFGTPAS
jgi:predicted NBD/HSP70 family sugar kinase